MVSGHWRSVVWWNPTNLLVSEEEVKAILAFNPRLGSPKEKLPDYQTHCDLNYFWDGSTYTWGAYQVAECKRICLPMQETQETWIQSLGQEDPLEKEMATHSSILAWKVPWTEVPGRLQSSGLQRVRHDWATEHTYTYRWSKAKIHIKVNREKARFYSFIDMVITLPSMGILCTWLLDENSPEFLYIQAKLSMYVRM